MAPAQWLLRLLLFLFLVLPRVQTESGDRFRLFCPLAPCWHYWNGNCYCIETNQEGTWAEALRYCKRYKYTELITFTSSEEKDWILDLALDNFWVGLNNLEEPDRFSWSEGTPANMQLPWLQLSHTIKKNTVYCVKILKLNLVALNCNTKAHWICKRNADVDRYQEHVGKVLLSPPGSPSQVHADLISAKTACLELREQCTGISVWNKSYALARGTALVKNEERLSAAYVKSDCSFGYFGVNCSSVCSRCYGDELCNPYTGTCDNFHSCRSQDSPAVCERALHSEWCPHFSGWRYWGSHCYYFSTEPEASWVDARKQCRRFRSTDLMWISSQSEMDWIFSLYTYEILWTGLNSRKQKSKWVWSDMKSAAKELNWLRLSGSPFGRCVGLASTNHTTLRLDCDKKHKWICKRLETSDLFDVYTDQFLSGPLHTSFYILLSNAVLDCLKEPNCTGIVQDYQYFRRTKGIDTIISYEETATSFVRRAEI
ncbi:secretory phospholipase A2 receptor-like [Anolis sagrei]|uniref:secretory phospholipase A2 receptor-like n=1 Tax=Anolis sagrei TaxID=38937 RepID=UPI003520C367